MHDVLRRHSGLINELLAAEEQRRSPMSHSDSIYIVTSKPDASGVYESAEQQRQQAFEQELARHQHEPGALKAQQPKELRFRDKQVGGVHMRNTAYDQGIDMTVPFDLHISLRSNPNARVEDRGQRTSSVPCPGAAGGMKIVHY